MFATLLGTLALLAVTIGIAFGVRRAWRSKRPLVRWPVAIIGSLFAILFALLTGAAIRGMLQVYPRVGRPVQAMTVERSPERIARGQHIAETWCAACHTLNGQLPLSGGKDLAKEIPPPIGSIASGNLTPGGRIKDWSDGEVFRAIREGADPTGTMLLVMSGEHVRNLSDDDIKSVIAFLRSQPAVEKQIPKEYLSLLGVVMAGAQMFPRFKEPPPITVMAPQPGATAEYGKYIVNWVGCAGCHGENLSGVTGGVLPPAPTLRVTKTWTSDQFVQTIRTGTNPFGKKLDSLMMPWHIIRRMSDDELTAIHRYLQAADIPIKQ